MAIKRLTELVLPPHSPVEIGSLREWEAAEKELGTILPRDYRAFVLKYGSGLFGGLYLVYNPFAKSEYTHLQSSVERICAIERQFSKRRRGNPVPYPLYPEKNGLLPWGRDENGNDYY